MDSVMGHLRTPPSRRPSSSMSSPPSPRGRRTPRPSASERGRPSAGSRRRPIVSTVMGFLEKADGRYRLTPSSAVFLDRRSPAFLGDIDRFSPRRKCSSCPSPTRRPSCAMAERFGLADMAPDDPVWVEFARHMAPVMRPVTQAIAAHFAGAGSRPPDTGYRRRPWAVRHRLRPPVPRGRGDGAGLGQCP